MDTPNNKRYELKVNSSTDNLSVIRKFVKDVVAEQNVPKEDIDKIIVAVDEASSNIIRHAYGLDHDGEIILTISFEGNFCKIELTDFGSGFNMSTVKRPDMESYLKEKRVGGLGIHLMKLLMDDVDYQSVEGKYNRLTLIKKLAADYAPGN